MNREIAGHIGSVKALDLAVRKKKFPLKFYWPECSCLLWRQTSFSLMSTWHRVKNGSMCLHPKVNLSTIMYDVQDERKK